MLNQERLNDGEEATRFALDGLQAQIWTALPGIIQSFDAGKTTCVVQPTIKGVVRKPDGSSTPVNMPLCVDCPVVFQRGGGCSITFPLKFGDECLIVFASRCIDAWWQQGGVQPQAELRMHDLSDGFAIPGVRSQVRTAPPIGLGARLTTDDGSVFVDVHAGGITSQGAWTHTGTIAASGDVTAGAISLENHVHTGVQSGSGNTGPATG